MRKNHLIDLNDLSRAEWDRIVDLAVEISNNPKAYSEKCKGKILATLFYEPSTRTQMSFQTAMIRLGGSVIGFDNPQNSSVSKGENLVDTIRIVSGYADVIAMRHPIEGSALAGAQYSECPLINAGDGGHLHPTQTLTDLVTLKKEIGSLDNLVVGICGDLKNGRTVHSLIKALCFYKNVEFILISTKELTLPQIFKDFITKMNCKYTEVTSIEEVISSLDVLYMTRIQRERFASIELYNQQKNVYVLDPKKLELAKDSLKILHPLPRVDEIDMKVDSDRRAIYFKQAKYGVFARMALIMTLLETDNSGLIMKGESSDVPCVNPKCVTNSESYLNGSYHFEDGQCLCEYCDTIQ